MMFELSFLDQRGKLSCLFVGMFSDHAHAESYAIHVLRTRACADLKSAEISCGHLPSVIISTAHRTSAKPATKLANVRA